MCVTKITSCFRKHHLATLNEYFLVKDTPLSLYKATQNFDLQDELPKCTPVTTQAHVQSVSQIKNSLTLYHTRNYSFQALCEDIHDTRRKQQSNITRFFIHTAKILTTPVGNSNQT